MKGPRKLVVWGSLLLICAIIITCNWIKLRAPSSKMPASSHKSHTHLVAKPHHITTKRKYTVARKLKPRWQSKKKPKGSFRWGKTKRPAKPTYLPLLDVLKAKNQPVPGKSIFFHETTGFRRNEKTLPLKLTAREACAIESAALHNQGLTVFVLFSGATHRFIHGDPLIKALNAYKNIRLRHLHLWRFAAGTPIEKWLKTGKIFKSKHLYPHVSDLLRYLTLYRFGGIYLDLDVVVLRSLEKMPPNFTGAETNKSLACGVMKMDNNGVGHRIAASCLQDLQTNYNANDWGSNGPGVITRIAKKHCNTTSIQSMIHKPSRCKGFKVFDQQAFYAVPWRQWKDFFESKKLNKTMKATAKSYVIHIWNKFSKYQKLKTRENNAYVRYAKINCPRTFAATGEYM
ncbi:hypothetical protein KR018_000710 [Drosophila ironensis]|nr:hypothetical protein KR018_000710 [Drosophila ironensis]